MAKNDFLTQYNESRNGTERFYFNGLYPRLNYSDGVRDCMQAGISWLVDIAGTEGEPAYRKEALRTDGILGPARFEVTVKDNKCSIRLRCFPQDDDGAGPHKLDKDEMATLFTKELTSYGLPDGKYLFIFGQNGVLEGKEGAVLMSLPSED